MPLSAEEAKKKYVERHPAVVADIEKRIDAEIESAYEPGVPLLMLMETSVIPDAIFQEVASHYPDWAMSQSRTRGDIPSKTRVILLDPECQAAAKAKAKAKAEAEKQARAQQAKEPSTPETPAV